MDIIGTDIYSTTIGLIGITLVIATGKIFDPLRAWLGGFSFRWNPLRFIGLVMECTMCSGWWVGFIWGISSGCGVASILVGGYVSVLSVASDEVLAVVVALSLRLVNRMQRPAAVPVPRAQSRTPHPEGAISENEADEIADKETEKADTAVSL